MIETLSRCDVAVIGAGIAGLTAADALTRGGADVAVFEARDRVGGRTLSVPAGTGTADLGATWFWPNEPVTLSIVDQLGLATFAQHLPGDALFENHHSDVQRLSGNPIDVPSTRFEAGAQALALRLAARLKPGALRLNNPVRAVSLAEGGATRLDARNGSLLADHVVLALPPALAVDQLTFTPELPAQVRAAAETTTVWMGGMVKAVAVYDAPFWRAGGLSGSAVSYAGPFREFHDHSGPGAAPASIFAFAPAEHVAGMDSDTVAAAFRRQLTRVFGPSAAEPRETHLLDWSREAFTTPHRPHPAASTATYGAALFQRPVQGRLHWACTEVAEAHAGHIEGALHAGFAAARRISEMPCPSRRQVPA